MLALVARGPGLRLWERRIGDPDFLDLRVGCGTLAAPIDIRWAAPSPPTRADRPPPDPLVLKDVPVTVSLPAVGVLGIAGPRHRAVALARALVVQLAVLHSPRDLRVTLLTEPGRADDWAWSRWLPHLRADAAAACQLLVGLDTETATARITELCALATQRTTAGPHRTASVTATPTPAVVVVVDGARELRRTTPLAALLARGPAAGIFAICLDVDEASLPEECGSVATFTGPTMTALAIRELRRTGNDPSPASDVVADGISVAWAQSVARTLAPLRDDSPVGGAAALPAEVAWLDLANVDRLEEQWAAPATTRGPTVVLGVGSDGVFALDLARDGPHALVAGTTGAGKSELLRTLVASLAASNRPDELGFVLVDYKGGAAFGACAQLPHTAGLVTDLDDGLVERALVSLRAELKRREALLAQAGVADISTYRSTGRPLARLVIVVDEFASLAEELPEFVGGLVGIAQRGRSLGVHLVLATQRPEGVVSADIRANTNLRICLAVTREAESRDVIDTPDAARISRTTPGRAFARTGHGELHAFQCARVGGAARAATTSPQVRVRAAPFESLARPAPGSVSGQATTTRTDLDTIVDACRAAAARLAIAPAPSPWLPPLPALIVNSGEHDGPLHVTIGVQDLPAEQARAPYRIDLTTVGHLLVVGSARSGRTTTLRTAAGALARATSTADLHMYALDCAGGSLRSLADLPHCGAVVTPTEPDRARRMLSMLNGELTRRQSWLAQRGLASLTEQRERDHEPLPHAVLLCDGWESMVSAFEDVDAGAVIDDCYRLLREGAAAGMHVVVTADRAGLVGRLASTIETRLVLRLADRGDFSLVGLSPRNIPADLGPGRGFVTDTLTQTQVCLLSDDASGPAQAATLNAIAAMSSERDAAICPARRPRRVDVFPERVMLCNLSMPAAAAANSPASRIVVGVGGDDVTAVAVDLGECVPGFVVAGPPRSGRSTTLATIARGLAAAGWRTVAVTPRNSVLRDVAEHVLTPADPDLATILAPAVEPAAGLAAEQGIGPVRRPLAVLVDDAELVTDSPAAAALDRIAREARDRGHLLILAGTTEDLCVGFRGFVVDARRGRCGLLLRPRGPLDGDVLGVRPPRNAGFTPPGRGLLVVRGEVTAVQVALPG